jgi:hypothetical protein
MIAPSFRKKNDEDEVARHAQEFHAGVPQGPEDVAASAR